MIEYRGPVRSAKRFWGLDRGTEGVREAYVPSLREVLERRWKHMPEASVAEEKEELRELAEELGSTCP